MIPSSQLPFLLHYGSIAFIMIATALGIGIGGGIASSAAIEAINIAPATRTNIFKLLLVALALIETSGIIGLIIALLLLGQPIVSDRFYFISIAECGIALAVGGTGFIVGLVSALPARQAVVSLTRQSLSMGKILNLMLLTQSITQTPVIFGFLVALLIKAQMASLADLPNAVRLLVAGFTIGIGSIGPAIGLANFAQAALKALGINRSIYGKLLPFTFISQAIIETPIIFAMLVSLIILFSPLGDSSTALTLIAYIASGISIALATFAPGISSSRVASSACLQIALNPNNYSSVSKISILGQGLIDTAAIYGLLISLLLLLFK